MHTSLRGVTSQITGAFLRPSEFALLCTFYLGSVVPYYSIIIGLLSVIIAVSAGLPALYKYHENWIEYRTTAETLKHEKHLFQAKCSPYDNDNSFCKLVQRVEGLISKENTQTG
jgi:hypothetical protein